MCEFKNYFLHGWATLLFYNGKPSYAPTRLESDTFEIYELLSVWAFIYQFDHYHF